jgi:hypothetical protein
MVTKTQMRKAYHRTIRAKLKAEKRRHDIAIATFKLKDSRKNVHNAAVRKLKRLGA